MDSIAKLIEEVRKFANEPRKQSALIQSHRDWNMLCSCMDVVEDTELAIQSYQALAFPEDDGARYIFVYGVLQALFSQQDAVQNLCEALNVPFEPDEDLKRIRDVRNDAIGHPTRRGKGRQETYNFISRVTMTKDGFQLMSASAETGESTFKDISLSETFQKQQNGLGRVLAIVVTSLRQEEAEHRAMYKEDKLQDVFPGTLGYYFSKLKEAIYGNRGGPYGSMHVRLIVQVLDKLKEKMEKRGVLDAYVGFNSVFEQLDYPLAELAKYFEGKSSLTDKGAYIFAYYAQKQFDELQTMAQEVDDEYQKPVEGTT